MAYWAIEITPGLDAADFKVASEGGANAEMVQDAPTVDLLDEAGFTIVEEREDTARYLETVQRWLGAARRLEAPLRQALGDQVYNERVSVRQRGFEVTDAGLHRRMFYVADPS